MNGSITLNRLVLQEVVQRALAEDLGTGDVTTVSTVPVGRRARAEIVSKAAGVLAGLPLVEEVYRQVDSSLTVSHRHSDGDACRPGDVLCVVLGSARSILVGER